MTGVLPFSGIHPLVERSQPLGGNYVQVAELTAISVLSYSRYAPRFPLHGAWAVAAWSGGLPRPTRGIDLLDRERGSTAEIVSALADALGPSPGCLTVDWTAIQIRTKAERRSALHRLCIPARLGHRRLELRIDVTAARHPGMDIEFRPLRLMAASRSLFWPACCTLEEIIAEKAAFLVTYGAEHTRLVDLFDLWLLLHRAKFDAATLIRTMAGVFEGRDAARMLERDDGYWQRALDPDRFDEADRGRWDMLVSSVVLPFYVPSLPDLVVSIETSLMPLLMALRRESKARFAKPTSR